MTELYCHWLHMSPVYANIVRWRFKSGNRFVIVAVSGESLLKASATKTEIVINNSTQRIALLLKHN